MSNNKIKYNSWINQAKLRKGHLKLVASVKIGLKDKIKTKHKKNKTLLGHHIKYFVLIKNEIIYLTALVLVSINIYFKLKCLKDKLNNFEVKKM